MNGADSGLANASAIMAPSSSAYQDALAWLYRTQRFGIKLGLENMQRLVHELGVPAEGQRVLHVAGTNGKGSVCAMIDAIARAHGYRAGLFTSPHLVTFRERIQVNGEMIAEEKVATGLSGIRELVRNWERHPTFFEITTALALVHFKECACELITLETGLGGRLDATNAVEPVVSAITPIGYDHQTWLGNTLEAIAGEKAGIIKPRVPVVTAGQESAAGNVIHARAIACHAPIHIVNESYTVTPVALAGTHQKQNAALAIATLRFGGVDVHETAIARGLASVDWPARFQYWDERTVIDGAHNPSGARVLVQTWREKFGSQRATLILATLSDKDIPGICQTLAPISDYVLLPRIRSQRAAAPETLEHIFSAITPALQCSITPSISDALEQARAKSAPILLTGSLHFAGEALAILRGEPAAFEECAQ